MFSWVSNYFWSPILIPDAPDLDINQDEQELCTIPVSNSVSSKELENIKHCLKPIVPNQYRPLSKDIERSIKGLRHIEPYICMKHHDCECPLLIEAKRKLKKVH